MNIQQLPAFLKPFFKSICLELTRPQYAHLWSLVLAIALNLRTCKLVHLTRLLPFSTHRTRHGAFLASDGFDSPRLLREAVARLIVLIIRGSRVRSPPGSIHNSCRTHLLRALLYWSMRPDVSDST